MRGEASEESEETEPGKGAKAAFERFHGYPSDKVLVIKKELHYHGHLADLGELEKIVVERISDGVKVDIKGFKGQRLAENEKHTQLFIEGGPHDINVKAFGIVTPHELYTLGEVVQVEYFTNKTHLGRQGGTATYVHKILKYDDPADLIYDSLNQQLLLSGGSYRILPEGIDR